METGNIYLILIGLAVFLNLQGWIYALQIFHTPSAPGYTWESVATGVSMIALGIGFALTLLFFSNEITLANLLAVPIVVVALLGGPMALLQIVKKTKSNKAVNTIENKHDFTNKL